MVASHALALTLFVFDEIAHGSARAAAAASTRKRKTRTARENILREIGITKSS